MIPIRPPSVPETIRPESPDIEEAIPVGNIMDQHFMTGFTLMSDMEPDEQRLVVRNLDPMPLDVDRWELVISPDEYLARFKDTLATVQLINRAPLRKLHTTYHRGPGFEKWLLLAQANHQLWVSPKYKDRFFTELNRYQTAQPGKLPMQASTGHAHVPTSVFIHCLNTAGCRAIRLKTYGQKMPLTDMFLTKEPAQTDHQWAKHNEWDIGVTFPSDHIWLFGSKTGRRRGFHRYPMMVPGSRDFGTVNGKVNHERRSFTVKIYPRLVHVIKSFNSHLQGGIPKTLGGLRNQLNAALKMIHDLTGKDDSGLGGFRIEVTVQAPSLKQALRRVKITRFLDPSYWFGLGDGPHSSFQLTARLVSRADYLANANWVYQQAIEMDLLAGDSNRKPTSGQVQVVTDVLNALGWNSGLRKPTTSLQADAWWNTRVALGTPGVFEVLSTLCQTDNQIKVLFNLARTTAGSIPCKAHSDDDQHRYQVNNLTPFRVRCGKAGCNHKLQRSAVIHWLSRLIVDDYIAWDGFKEELEHVLADMG